MDDFYSSPLRRQGPSVLRVHTNRYTASKLAGFLPSQERRGEVSALKLNSLGSSHLRGLLHAQTCKTIGNRERSFAHAWAGANQQLVALCGKAAASSLKRR